METKELKICVPDGYEIDRDASTFERIVFKKKYARFIDDKDVIGDGYYINNNSDIINGSAFILNRKQNMNVFANEAQARRSLAMARLSQIMANDARFGGVVSDEEWGDDCNAKWCITRYNSDIRVEDLYNIWHFLAFHTREQAELFLDENRDLIRDYFMLH